MTPALLTAIAALLEGASRKDLAMRAARLSAAYRQGGTSAVIGNEADALAYLVTRMPATYAAIRAALRRVTEVLPEFAPASFLDVGAGPGTAAWAARDMWPSIAVTLVETPYFTTKPSGSGLGMIIARKVIEDHGGTIRLESKEGIGTRVIVRLPVSQSKGSRVQGAEGSR